MVGARDGAPTGADRARFGISRRALGEALLVGLGCVVVLAWRAPIATRQFWAEDGRVFFQDALDKGPISPFADAYGGYFHFVPRAIGALASIGPLRYAATTTWALVALGVGVCAATVFLMSVPWLTSVAARLTMAAGLVLLPSMNDESIANAANLQFLLLFTALVVLIGVGRGRGMRIWACTLLVVTGLTTPLAAALAPLALWRVVRQRPRRVDAEVASWAGGVAAQLLAIVATRPDRGAGNVLTARQIVRGYATRVLYLNVSPTDHASRVGPVVVAVILVAVIGAATLVAFRRGDRSKSFLLVAVPATGVILYVFAGVRLGLAEDLPPRYELVPAWTLVWAALVATETLAAMLVGAGRLRPRTSATLVVAVCVALTVSWSFHWSVDPYRSAGPTWGASLSDSTQRCRDDPSASGASTVAVAIMPTGGDPPDWSVHIRCDALR